MNHNSLLCGRLSHPTSTEVSPTCRCRKGGASEGKHPHILVRSRYDHVVVSSWVNHVETCWLLQRKHTSHMINSNHLLELTRCFGPNFPGVVQVPWIADQPGYGNPEIDGNLPTKKPAWALLLRLKDHEVTNMDNEKLISIYRIPSLKLT